jgi:hypothetical protein
VYRIANGFADAYELMREVRRILTIRQHHGYRFILDNLTIPDPLLIPHSLYFSIKSVTHSE